MLAHLRNAPLRSSSSSWLVTLSSCRHLSSTPARRQEEEEEEQTERSTSRSSQLKAVDFERWLSTEGKKYEHPFRPRNWLGGQVPFPLNPSFKPPTPISDKLRTLIYSEYMSDPQVYNVRKLSERHGISIQRVHAILRLKGLEAHWIKKKPLQTGFVDGMEQVLGVAERQSSKSGIEAGLQGMIQLGEDASQADIQMANDGNNRARERFQRLFWEPVVEGEQPIVAASIERARQDAQEKTEAIQQAKAARAGVPPHKHAEHIVEVPGRPTWNFVDVGGKYVDVNDRLHRIKESERRSRLRAQKRVRKASLAESQTREKAAAAT